jgi:hypothetical protein
METNADKSFAWCGVHLSGCLAEDARFERKKNTTRKQKGAKATDSDAFQHFPSTTSMTFDTFMGCRVR